MQALAKQADMTATGAEALRILADDAGLRARMGEAGRAKGLSEFDEAVVLKRTLDLLGA